MLSQHGCVTVSILALSGAPRQLSQRESLCRRGEASRNIQSLSLWEQQRRPPPVAETGSRCWGRGQQDASESEADAGSRNPGSVTEGDGEGKPVAKRLLTQRWASAFVKAIGSLCKSFHSGILALSGAPRQLSQRESLCRRGEASRNIQSLSLWERCHRR